MYLLDQLIHVVPVSRTHVSYPIHAIVADFDPGNFEIVLKVEGATESQDRVLSFLVLQLKELMLEIWRVFY